MPGLLGKEIGMTSVFSADGKNVPCTVIEAGPCVVTQIKSVEKDGYAANCFECEMRDIMSFDLYKEKDSL